MESSGKRPTDTDRILLHKLVQEEGFSTSPAEIVDHILDRSTVVCLRSGEPLISLGFVNPYFLHLPRRHHTSLAPRRQPRSHLRLCSGRHTILDYHSYLGKGSACNIEACTPARLIRLRWRDYDELLNINFEFCRWRLMMAYNQMFFMEFKNSVFMGNARERYLQLLAKRPEIIRHVSLKIIASYLGVTPNYLSNLRHSLATD